MLFENINTDNKDMQLRSNTEVAGNVAPATALTPAPILQQENPANIYTVSMFDLRSIFDLIRRKKKIIFFTTLLTLLLTVLYTASIPVEYRAGTTLKIERDTGNSLVSFDVNTDKKPIDHNIDFYKTQYDLLASRTLANRVITELGLEDLYENNKLNKKKNFVFGKLLEFKRWGRSLFNFNDNTSMTGKLAREPFELKFLKKLTISPNAKTQIVRIYYDSVDPELAALTINTLAENFIAINLERRVESASFAKEFLEEQIAIAKTNLSEAERKLNDYARKNEIIKTENHDSLVSTQLDTLNDAYAEAKKNLIMAKAQYDQGARSATKLQYLDNPVIQSLKDQETTLLAKYNEKIDIYRPDYPLMKELRNKINETKKQIKKEQKNISSDLKGRLYSEYIAASQTLKNIKKELNKNKSKFLSNEDNMVNYNILSREVSSSKQIYKGLLQRLKEVNIASGVTVNNITVIDKAFVPYKRFTPNIKINLLLGSIFGLFLGLFIVFFFDFIDDKIKSIADIGTISDLPVLGIFPTFRGSKKQQKSVLVYSQPQSAAAEALRALVTTMSFSSPLIMSKMLVVTSSNSGEGKTSTAINLAAIHAEDDKRVIVVDADLRRPTGHKILNLDPSIGLTSIMIEGRGIKDTIQKTHIPNLSFLACGPITSAPVQLLSSKKFSALLDILALNYDYVIIDSPPVLGLADALILSNRAHATLFAVASNQTKKSQLKASLTRLQRAHGNVAGFILTKDKIVSEGYDNYYNYHNTDSDLDTIEFKPKPAIEHVG